MNTFKEWFKTYYVEHGFISSEKEAKEIWNAALSAAQHECVGWRSSRDVETAIKKLKA